MHKKSPLRLCKGDNIERWWTMSKKDVIVGASARVRGMDGVMGSEKRKKCNRKLRGCEGYLAPFDDIQTLKMTERCQQCVQNRHEFRLVIIGIVGGFVAGLVSSVLVLFLSEMIRNIQSP